ncbi:MAG: hypothetical protein ACLUD0_10845 [Eubacterium ramulus]
MSQAVRRTLIFSLTAFNFMLSPTDTLLHKMTQEALRQSGNRQCVHIAHNGAPGRTGWGISHGDTQQIATIWF